MKRGGWVPISKGAVQWLPSDRPFSRAEALFSLAVSYDEGEAVSVAGLAKLWGWNRKTVSRFLADLGVVIRYPEDTRKMQRQKGQIGIQVKGQIKGQINFHDSKNLRAERDRSGDRSRDRSLDTTIDPRSLTPDWVNES